MSDQNKLPDIPREQWHQHPNFPNQVLLLGSHRNFRSISSILVQGAQAGESVPVLRSLYERWIGAMRSHEAYEERKLYPYLSQRWGVSFAPSTKGHEELHDAHDAVIEAFDSGIGVIDALQRHDRVLREHLEIEEDQVIPLLLELTAEEFTSYYHGY